jgi:ABC-type dipeptide/oligopeptide/nickel transport system permease subunit
MTAERAVRVVFDGWVAPRPSPMRRAGRLARQYPLGVFGLVIMVGFVVLGVFGADIAPYNPRELRVGKPLEGPSWEHPFGLNSLGQDILSRVMAGARVSLIIGSASIFIGSTIGSFLGILGGYFGRWVDYTVQRSSEAFAAFPGIILYFLLRAAFGQGVKTIVISIAIGALFSGSRVLRSRTLVERAAQYVEAARAMGASEYRVFFNHIMRNLVPLVVVLMSTALGGAILAESALAFLGIGLEPTTPSWGLDMSGDNLTFARLGKWHIVVFPGLAITLVVLAANLLGDALRDIWDPRLRR